MKNAPAPRSAFVALFPATLLLAAPAVAQEVQPATAAPVQTQTVTPPPVVPTIAPPAAVPATPPAATVTPPPVTSTASPSADTAVDAAPAPRVTVRTARTTTRTTRAARTEAPARAVAAPAATAAPIAAAPAPAVAPEPAPAPAAQPAADTATPAPAAADTAATQTTTTEGGSVLPWLILGALALGALAFFLMRRRRRDHDEEVYYDEPYVDAEPVAVAPIHGYEEPVMAPAEPVAVDPKPQPEIVRAAPLAAVVGDEPVAATAEEVSLAEPEAEDVASLTEASAPVANRPWLEFSLRPVRAGTNVDEALVEIELTVGNAGSVAAEDVRISTFMFASEPADGSEMERLLVERGEDGVQAVTIAPGEGTRVDATLALPRADLIDSTDGEILPIVVADARYTLPDGTEGRTSASFTIGVSGEGGRSMTPIRLTERAMRDDVEARLHGVPEHA